MSHSLFNVRIDDYTERHVLDMVRQWVSGHSTKVIVTPNPEFLLEARKNKTFSNLLAESDLSVADGVAIRYALAALYGSKLKNRITGVDLIQKIAEVCAQTGSKLLLLGGAPDAAQLSASALKSKLPELNVKSFDPGHLECNQGTVSIPQALATMLEDEKPDVIAVALGQVKQEAFMSEVKKMRCGVKVMIGIGGALDMISGKRKRSPLWMRKAGLEWVWRLMIEPQRARRIIRATFVFPLVVVLGTIKNRRLIRACRDVFPEVFKQLRGL